MDDQKLEQAKNLYQKYLLSESNHECLVCDTCGWMYTHPLNYCVKCPGSIVRTKLVVWEIINKFLKQDRMMRDFMAGFSEFYEGQTGENFPFDEFRYPSYNYYELYNILLITLGRKPFDKERL